MLLEDWVARWLVEVASPVARRGEFPRWWRGMVSVVEGIGRCGGWCKAWVAVAGVCGCFVVRLPWA